MSEHGAAVYNAPVYLFTNTGTYLGRMLRTDSAGFARFRIPAKAYKFRVDYNNRQYWSDVVNLLPNEETAVALQLDLLALDSTNDPAPVRVDGTPTKPEQKPWAPQKRVLLASLFEISGILANGVVGQLPPQGGIYYYVNDHLGTPQKIMDQSGAVVWSGDYQPFGKVNASVADLGNNFRFPGQYFDQETGLHNNWHRFYDPRTGRYLTPDPIGLAGGINLYSYARNNPTSWVDPYGLWGINASGSVMAIDFTKTIYDSNQGWFPDNGNVLGVSTTAVGFGGQFTFDTPIASTTSPANDLNISLGILSKYLGATYNTELSRASVNLGLGIGLPVTFSSTMVNFIEGLSQYCPVKTYP